LSLQSTATQHRLIKSFRRLAECRGRQSRLCSRLDLTRSDGFSLLSPGRVSKMPSHLHHRQACLWRRSRACVWRILFRVPHPLAIRARLELTPLRPLRDAPLAQRAQQARLQAGGGRLAFLALRTRLAQWLGHQSAGPAAQRLARGAKSALRDAQRISPLKRRGALRLWISLLSRGYTVPSSSTTRLEWARPADSTLQVREIAAVLNPNPQHRNPFP
jgi:hypothetical protein